MIYCYEPSHLQQIPQDLIDDLDTIKTYVNAFPYKEVEHIYASYVAPEKLTAFIQNQFDTPVMVRYQVISEDLEVHIDHGTDDYKLNYLVHLGGDNVITRWWNSEQSDATMLHSEVFESHKWYKLNVAIPHDVVGIISPRVSIVVRPQAA
jgi:hypothetical protein